MRKLYEKSVIDGDRPFYFGIWDYDGRIFKITSTLNDSTSVWRIDVRTNTGKWTFETGNLIFENTLASYTIEDAGINIRDAFNRGIEIAEDYLKSVY